MGTPDDTRDADRDGGLTGHVGGAAARVRRAGAPAWRRSAGNLLCAVLVLSSGAGVAATGAPPPMIDAHSHYSAEHAAVLSPADIVARLDAAGVHAAVISGTPAALAQRLHRHAPDRIWPFLGVYASDRDKATWMHDAALPRRVRALLDSGAWAGLGELHLFAADAHSPVFEALVRLAAERDLVLMLHGDAEVVDRAFAIAPALRVLWAHLGTEPTPERVAQVLARHAGRALWVDTSVRDERIAPGGMLLPDWRALFARHPERFVVAVDAFSTGRWRRYGDVVHTIRTWVQALPPSLARQLLHDNAAAMLGTPPASGAPKGAVR